MIATGENANNAEIGKEGAKSASAEADAESVRFSNRCSVGFTMKMLLKLLTVVAALASTGQAKRKSHRFEADGVRRTRWGTVLSQESEKP